MTNFNINFAYPWLLLLLVPALFLALFAYFRLSKKFRRTRNRVISLVLHVIVTVSCVLVLSGLTFSYDTGNNNKELLIVADFSYSGETRDDDKLEFVRSIIEEGNENYKIGVITFGYNQIYAAELNNDAEKVYDDFLNAPMPDNSATDIASALRFAREKITEPDSAKIVLISDGVQTDGDALGVIRSITADGVQVNSAYFESNGNEDEAQIIGAILPNTNPAVSESFEIGVTIQSSFLGNAVIECSDNGHDVSETNIVLEAGIRDYTVKCEFSEDGLHVLKFSVKFVEGQTDGVAVNNEFYTYINIENFNKLLIIERNEGESGALKDVLENGEKQFDVTVVNIKSEDLPVTVDGLREYDQVVLNNISNGDMPDGFIENLNSYVKDFGGGMFTVGGNKIDNDGKSVANTYVEDDMAGTLYQEMLPVQAIEFTPPVAVMIIIDKSGSMNDMAMGSRNKMDAAKEGAKSAIRALTSRDYCGIMTLTEEFTVEQQLLPVTQSEWLFRTIDNIEAEGGTHFTPAIERAGRILAATTNVERRHILLVSDGYPNDKFDSYSAAVKRNYENAGITFSLVAIGLSSSSSGITDFETVTGKEYGNGRFYNVQNTDDLENRMREELNVAEIKSVNYETFVPTIKNYTSVVDGINPILIPSLGGFYGTRVKDEQLVSVPLNGKYVPIYAQWNYGEGRVGSFMCDLTGGEWSGNFVTEAVGKLLINNMVTALLPTQNIHPQDIDVGFEEDNYTTNISVYTSLGEGEKLQVSISEVSDNGNDAADRIITPDAQDGYSRIRVAITNPGVYKITVNKLDAEDNVLGTYSAYRAFSYSKEYEMFYDKAEAENLLQTLADLGGGEMITGAWQLFGDPVTYIHHTVDPRMALLITSLVLFLLDIAVRKFKFKWIHEIINERKAQKSEQGA